MAILGLLVGLPKKNITTQKTGYIPIELVLALPKTQDASLPARPLATPVLNSLPPRLQPKTELDNQLPIKPAVEPLSPPPPPAAKQIENSALPEVAPLTASVISLQPGTTQPAAQQTERVVSSEGAAPGTTAGELNPGKVAYQVGAETSTTQSNSGGSAPATSISDKGAYQPFHRLTRLPIYKTRIEPVYPLSERIAGREVRVLVEIFLNVHGGVDAVTIKKSGGEVFDQAVIRAVRASSFEPGYAGEQPVPTLLQIPYVFKLR